MAQPPIHIAVVGGGSAGWLSALMLQRSLGARARITLVESPNIPTVGVGEGSTSVLRQVLMDLGLNEEEFLREARATIKFGICHKNWGRKPGAYFGPIDDPNLLAPPPPGAPGAWLHLSAIGAGKPVEAAHLFTYLMKAKRSPVAKTAHGKRVPVSQFHHAFHFDQSLFGKFLASKAEGVAHVSAEVCDITRDGQTGAITHLVLQDQPDLAVDFVVDCTGFRREINGRMGAAWRSYADMLPLNKAMPFWLPIGDEIAPYTLAQAQSAGWMWNIATQDRIGCGYVFSDAHQTPDQAQAEIETTLGQKIEPRGLIAINPGRQEQAWIKNCVAVGLSQSFLEPLEATSIHGTIVQLILLSRAKLNGANAQDRDRYNATVASQVDDFAHFINLHYAGGRTDTPFWQDMTAEGLTDVTKARLETWQYAPVSRAHFPGPLRDLPHVQEQLYIPVLDGLGLLPKSPAKNALANSPSVRAAARKTMSQLTSEFRAAARQAMGHRAYLTSLTSR